MEFLREMLSFLRAQKKLWMLPVILVMLMLGGLLLLAQGTAFAPFIYTVF